MTSVAAAIYRFTAGAVAGTVSAMPLLERPLVWVGTRVWDWPGAGRFYRSIIGRYTDRLRGSEARFRSVQVFDAAFVADVTEFTTSTLYFGNRPYEPATTEYLRQTLKPGRVFVDIGANHGYFTLLAAALVGASGRVASFEPNPEVFAQLAAHVAANHFDDRTDLVPLALSDRSDDHATLYISTCRTNSGLSTLVPDAARFAAGSVSHEHTVDVRVETFDRWLAASRLDRVDVVKIDTEGWEDRVVDGMAGSLLAGRVGSVICETQAGTRAYQALAGAGYQPQPLETIGIDLTNFVFSRE